MRGEALGRAAAAGAVAWLGEVVVATQLRDSFVLGPAALLGLAIYLAVPMVLAALGGARLLGWGFAALAAASFGLQIFEEGSIAPPIARIVLAIAAVPAALVWLRRRGPEARLRWGVALWCFTAAIDRVPRDFVLDAYNFQWQAVALDLLRLIAALGGGWLAARLVERRGRRLAWAALLAAVLLVGLLSPLPLGRPAIRAGQGSPDIVYIVLDSLRYDATSLSPHAPGSTPALEALAARGLSFREARSPSTMTTYSLPLLTGLAGGEARGPRTRWNAVRASWPRSLPGRLQAAGYRAHLLSDYASTTLEGFEVYAWDSVASRPARWARLLALPAAWAAVLTGEEERLSAILGDKHPFGSGGAAADLERLLDRADAPGFYLVHLAVPHAPYNLPPYQARSLPPPDEVEARALFGRFQRLRGPASPEDRDALRGLYAAAVRAADEQLASVLAVIARSGRPAVVAVTSDHGEPLGEHGVFGHGRTLHAEAHHVPLVLAGPGVPAGLRVDAPVSVRHLPEALAQLAGGAEDGPRALLEAASAEPVVAIWHPRGTCVQSGRWSLVWTEAEHLLTRPAVWAHREPYELFDRLTDPQETRNRFAEKPAELSALLDALETHPAIPESSRAQARLRRPR